MIAVSVCLVAEVTRFRFLRPIGVQSQVGEDRAAPCIRKVHVRVPSAESKTVSYRHTYGRLGIVSRLNGICLAGAAVRIQCQCIGVDLPNCRKLLRTDSARGEGHVPLRGIMPGVCPADKGISFSDRLGEGQSCQNIIRTDIARRIFPAIQIIGHGVPNEIPCRRQFQVLGFRIGTFTVFLGATVPPRKSMPRPDRGREYRDAVVGHGNSFGVTSAAVRIQCQLVGIRLPHGSIRTTTPTTGGDAKVFYRLGEPGACPSDKGITPPGGLPYGDIFAFQPVSSREFLFDRPPAEIKGERICLCRPGGAERHADAISLVRKFHGRRHIVPRKEFVSLACYGFELGKVRALLIETDCVLPSPDRAERMILVRESHEPHLLSALQGTSRRLIRHLDRYAGGQQVPDILYNILTILPIDFAQGLRHIQARVTMAVPRFEPPQHFHGGMVLALAEEFLRVTIFPGRDPPVERQEQQHADHRHGRYRPFQELLDLLTSLFTADTLQFRLALCL